MTERGITEGGKLETAARAPAQAPCKGPLDLHITFQSCQVFPACTACSGSPAKASTPRDFSLMPARSGAGDALQPLISRHLMRTLQSLTLTCTNSEWYRTVARVGKMDAKKHLDAQLNQLMSSNILQCM